MNACHKDLAVLVADKNMETTVRGLLPRSESLGIRKIAFDIFVHPQRDPGCFRRGHDFLRPMVNRYAHALLLFDREGSGQERKTRDVMVSARLAGAGWADRAAAVVLDPELETWVWSDSPEVDRGLGWEGRQTSLRDWLEQQGVWPAGQQKPTDPKDAVERALRHVRLARSSSIYGRLAGAVSLRRCQDASLAAFRNHLQNWFPPSGYK